MSSEEVRHRAESSEARAAAVSDIQELMRRKEEIEAQIKANYDVLESQKGIGMNEPLVDCEATPGQMWICIRSEQQGTTSSVSRMITRH